MVSLRREVKSNDDVYGGYRVRFGANQNTYGFNPDNEDYDSRYPSNYGESVAINQGRERFYPSDRSAEKGARMGKSSKLLIVLFIVISALFIGLAIANSSTIAGANAAESAQKQSLSKNEIDYTASGIDITAATNGEMLTMTQATVDGEEVGEYDLIPEGAAVSYKKTSNWFNDICKIFG